jgi:hypothetical protein
MWKRQDRERRDGLFGKSGGNFRIRHGNKNKVDVAWMSKAERFGNFRPDERKNADVR